jgi:ribosome maturation factor RimP
LHEKIKTLAETLLTENPDLFADCFLLGVKYKDRPVVGPRIEVFIDADAGITIDQCTRLNRKLQFNFDENPTDWFGEKYALDVSSPGVGQPLQLYRQYPRNIGRMLKLTLKDGMIVEGNLAAVTEEALTIAREISYKDLKKKKTIRETVEVLVPFDSLEKAVVVIGF